MKAAILAVIALLKDLVDGIKTWRQARRDRKARSKEAEYRERITRRRNGNGGFIRITRESTGWLVAVALAVLLFIALAFGCSHTPASGPGADWSPAVYYLYPGDPAPVEGPQLSAPDFERLLDELENLRRVGLAPPTTWLAPPTTGLAPPTTLRVAQTNVFFVCVVKQQEGRHNDLL